MLRHSFSAGSAQFYRLVLASGTRGGGAKKAGRTSAAAAAAAAVASVRCSSSLLHVPAAVGAEQQGATIMGGGGRRGAPHRHQHQPPPPPRRRRQLTSSFSTDPSSPPPAAAAAAKSSGSGSGIYAAVRHGLAYEASMSDRHGAQLRLAYEEGLGKDDPPYDPFKEFIPDEEGLLGLDDDDAGYDDEQSMQPGAEESRAGGETVSAEDRPLSDDGGEVVDAEMEEDGDEDEDEEDGMDEDEEEEEDELEALSGHLNRYNKDGSVRRSKSQLVALKSGLPAGGMFAVINLHGSQQKVSVDDVVIVNKLRPVERWAVGSTITLTDDDVLLVGSSHLTLVGLPGVKGAEVDVMVEEITRDATVLVFKKRRRKHSRRKNGFRREVTMLRVLDIRMPVPYADHEHRERI